MSTPILIHLKLEVRAGDKIMVPGCEPTSALTSDTLSRSMNCGQAIVDLDAALAAIPGSFVEYTVNSSNSSVRKKYFVLPGIDTSCPCVGYPDYYRILRELANEEAPIEDSYDYCDVIGMGYCPSPGFQDIPPPPDDPYVTEGTLPNGVGVLTFPPAWTLNNDS